MSRATRWCPTPEQLMILEELYRGGLRTPKAPLIQKITAHLSLYGKIEGKNVFYWFQNHKARDRQKLRKKLTKHLLQQQQQQQQVVLFHQGLQLCQQRQGSPLLRHHQHHLRPPPMAAPVPVAAAAAFHQLRGSYDSTALLHQNTADEASTRSSSGEKIWKVADLSKGYETSTAENHCVAKTCGHDWLMMVDMMGPTVSSCNSINTSTSSSLRTLDLFPTTSSSLKNDEQIR